MKYIRFVGIFLVLAGGFGLLLAWVVPTNLKSRARLVQRVKPYDADTAAITGEVGTLIGDPQMMIIDDEKAFFPFKPDQAARLLNDDYMKEHGKYPLQLKTVEFVGGLVRIGSLTSMLLGGIVWALGRRNLFRK